MKMQAKSLCSVLQNAITEKRINFIYSYRSNEYNLFIILANDKVLECDDIDQKAFLVEAKVNDGTHNYFLSIISAEEWFDLTTELSNYEKQYTCYGKETLIDILPEISRILTTYKER